MPDVIRFHEIMDISDDLLLPWLDLYEQAFPSNEKVPVSDHLSLLKRGRELPEDRHLLAALDESGGLVGMARYEVQGEDALAYLVYLAVQTARRSLGIGKIFYAEIVRRIRAQQPSTRALIMEVERPDQAHSEEGWEDAERRIRFYRRQGVHLLRGINYLQEVAGHPPIPMHVMVHPFVPLSAEEAFLLVGRLLDVSRTQDQLGLD